VAFREVSHLYSLEEAGVSDLPRAEWLRIVESRPSAKSKGLPRTDRIISIDVSGPETAFVKVVLVASAVLHGLPDAVELPEGWRVVSKTFRTARRA
jgi:Putative lumazine-binding